MAEGARRRWWCHLQLSSSSDLKSSSSWPPDTTRSATSLKAAGLRILGAGNNGGWCTLAAVVESMVGAVLVDVAGLGCAGRRCGQYELKMIVFRSRVLLRLL
ncbi:hypothetical protein Dimus_035539 [Dionaea muscipula]